MSVTWLEILAVGLPLIGALAIWRLKGKLISVQQRLTAVTLGLSGLIALALFLLYRHYACIFLSGRDNCLASGLATLSLLLLNAILVRGSFSQRDADDGYGYILMLLLSSSWAGMVLAGNLLILLIFLNLFFYVIYKWLNRKGLGWGFLVVRNDYDDDRDHYHDDRE